MICLPRFLWTGCALLLCPILFADPEPKRSLEEDVAILVQTPYKDGKQWDGKPIKIEKPVKILNDFELVSPVVPSFVFVKGFAGIGCEFKGKEEFLKKPGVKGLLRYELSSSKGGVG